MKISSPEADNIREDAIQAFSALRAQAKDNGVAGMSLDEINEEIALARMESGA